MCGINGIISTTPLSDASLVARMNAAIVHRGPDDDGQWSGDTVQLGMRRLAIIDLGDGKQPMISADGRYVLVFNGEIYNYKTLRTKLIAAGAAFKTQSDTEVILHAFERQGSGCFATFEGMFAIAIYDTILKELILCRDRFGKKPLYFGLSAGKFVFASELKSLLEVWDHKLSVNHSALAHALQLSYIPAPHTIYQGIGKLAPATFMRVRSDLSHEVCTYWALRDSFSAETMGDSSSATAALQSLVSDCVAKRMVADVPVGALLSGGVDSSIITGIMARHSDLPIRTFSVANTVRSYDESDKARQVSRLFKTQHTEWLVNGDELLQYLYEAIDTFDEPFCDAAAIPFFIISKKAAEHVKVVLTGDGGDEMFGGYTRYLVHRYARMYRHLPSLLRRHVVRPLLSAAKVPVSLAIAYNKIRKLAAAAEQSDFEVYLSMVQLGYSAEELNHLGCFLDSQVSNTVRRIFDSPGASASPIRKAQYCDTVLGLEGQMLPKVDRTSMRASIEVRCPLLDHRVAELAFSFADSLKVDEGRGRLKVVLKQAFADMFPPGFLDKPKLGFGIPIGQFLRNELAHELRELVAKSHCIEALALNRQFITEALTAHFKGKDRTHILWPFFVTARWYTRNSRYLAQQPQ